MKAISVMQPWAGLIVHAGKNIENRKWKTKFRGEILIHASKKIDRAAMTDLIKNQPAIYLMLIQAGALATGGIIGKVEIVDCVEHYPSVWFQGPIGFVLKNPQPLPFEKSKGKLGIYEYKKEAA